MADIWISARDRNRIAEFAEQNAMLEHDAHLVGESREGSRRIVLEPPLGAAFSVDQDSWRVLVLDIWLF
ncbi:MAG: hypothetical protein AB7U97_26060 [Pirellulales bacterium]